MKFGAIDTDAEIELAAKFGVMGLPTLLVLKHGQVIDRIVGYTPKSTLKKRLDALLG